MKLPRITRQHARTATSIIVELGGLGCIVAAISLWNPLVGLAVGGIALVYIAQGI